MSAMKPYFLTVFLSSALLGMFSAPAVADEIDALRGQAFSDPTKETAMPEEWIKNPLNTTKIGRKGLI